MTHLEQPEQDEAQSTHDKALHINIDGARYGTFAEIGAGQEVARWFFRVGGAAATVAKTTSAYDASVSDAAYGPTKRYVSRERLQAMLDHEWSLLLERLDSSRGATTRFFVFADTVAAKSWTQSEAGRGWLGIRFQTEPKEPPSQIIIHARMWDQENARQQDALGILGVNLLHAAFYERKPEDLIGALMDGLTRDRMEVDMVKFSGQAFGSTDNRLMSLQLVEQRLTNAVMFATDGEVLEPAEVLHGMPVLIERGSFRPATRVTLDMLEQALTLMRADPEGDAREPVAVMEMTLRNLMTPDERIDHADFLSRMDILRALGRTVMISNYSRFHSVTGYFRRYTKDRIGIVLGVPTLEQLFEESHYEDLEGGLLEALGRLLSGAVKLYVYPVRDPKTGQSVTADSFTPPAPLAHLYAYLAESGRVAPIEPGRGLDLAVFPRDVLAMIRTGRSGWEPFVPDTVARVIKDERLFGYGGPPP